MKRENNCVTEWNFRAKKEQEREVRSLKIFKHHHSLWGGSLNGKELAKKYARRHAL